MSGGSAKLGCPVWEGSVGQGGVGLEGAGDRTADWGIGKPAPMVNRTAVILRYKEPLVRWINETDPGHDSPDITVEANEQNVYLIPPIEYAQDVDDWIELNYWFLFENERAIRLVHRRKHVAAEQDARALTRVGRPRVSQLRHGPRRRAADRRREHPVTEAVRSFGPI
jgi:hypothetical protein